MLFSGLLSIVTLIVMCVTFLLVGYVWLLVKFNKIMQKGGYPAPKHSGLFGWFVMLFVIPRHARRAGKVWFAERDHWIVAAVALAIAIWGLAQAWTYNDYTYFERAGSLIAVLGFLSTFIGSLHADGLFQARHTFDTEKATLERAANAERAQGLSSRWVFCVTASGTLIWGYGSIFLGFLRECCR